MVRTTRGMNSTSGSIPRLRVFAACELGEDYGDYDRCFAEDRMDPEVLDGLAGSKSAAAVYFEVYAAAGGDQLSVG